MATYRECPSEVLSIAEELINQYHPKLQECKIGFVMVDEAPTSGGKTVVAKVSKVPEKLRSKMPLLRKKYREVATSHNQNNGYRTHGLIIPFEIAKSEVADGVIYFFPDLERGLEKVFSRYKS